MSSEPLTLRPFQVGAIDYYRSTWSRGNAHLGVAATGAGKCHPRGTRILMFDGSAKFVEDVVVGDQLMGPDSRPRNVLSTTSGIDEMFEIKPTKGDPWGCNAPHVLSLKCTADHARKYEKDAVLNIPLDRYLAENKNFKHMMKLWRTGVEFQERKVEHDPYVLGVWLGDGTRRHPQITNSDPEIVAYLKSWASRHSMGIRELPGNNTITFCFSGSTRKHFGNPLKRIMRDCLSTGEKRVPFEFRSNSRMVRLQVLAGLIDADGYLNRSGYEVTFRDKGLAEDTAFLARSVGLAAYIAPKIGTIKSTGFKGNYWRVTISGDCSAIPCLVDRRRAPSRRQKKDVLKTGFDVIPKGRGIYYGFEIDGDHLYLLGDFTVTHNTVLFVHLASQIVPRSRHRFVVLAHREALIRQAAEKARRFAPNLRIAVERGQEKAREEDDFIVSSFQTMKGERLACFLERIGLRPSLRCRPENRRPVFLVVDEAHHSLAPSYLETIKALTDHEGARLLGVTATPFRTDDDSGENLRALYPHLAFKIERGPMIDDGWLARPCHFLIKTENSLYGVKSRAGDYVEKDLAAALDLDNRNQQILDVLRDAAESGLPDIGQKVLRGVIFSLSVDHAEKLAELIRKVLGWEAKAITAETPVAERAAWDRKLAENPGHTVLTSYGVLTEGWDVEEVNVGLFARPTKSRVLADQMIGRTLRFREDKPKVLLIDLEDADADGRVSMASVFHLPPTWNGKGGCLREDERFFAAALKRASYSIRSRLWECSDRAEVEAALGDPNRGPVLIETTGYMWWDMGPDELRLPVGKEGTVVVSQTDFGDFAIEWRAGTIVQELATAARPLSAMTDAQGWVEEHFPTEASFLRIRPGSDDRPCSEGQLEYMKRLGIPAPPGTSMKDSRIAISIAVVEALRLAEEGRCTFGKFKGTLVADVPRHYLEWALGDWLGKSKLPDRLLFAQELERRGDADEGRSLKRKAPSADTP